MWFKKSNSLKLGIKLGIKVFNILLLNSLSDILLLNLTGWGLIAQVGLLIGAKVTYNLGGR